MRWGLIVETKVLKQLVRDVIQPSRDLGHSDKKGHKAKEPESTSTSGETKEPVVPESKTTTLQPNSATQVCEDCQ